MRIKYVFIVQQYVYGVTVRPDAGGGRGVSADQIVEDARASGLIDHQRVQRTGGSFLLPRWLS